MRWSVTVVDTNGDPVEVSFDSDTGMAGVSIEGRGMGSSGLGVTYPLSPRRVILDRSQLRAIVNVVSGWPIHDSPIHE